MFKLVLLTVMKLGQEEKEESGKGGFEKNESRKEITIYCVTN